MCQPTKGAMISKTVVRFSLSHQQRRGRSVVRWNKRHLLACLHELWYRFLFKKRTNERANELFCSLFPIFILLFMHEKRRRSCQLSRIFQVLSKTYSIFLLLLPADTYRDEAKARRNQRCCSFPISCKRTRSRREPPGRPRTT